MKNPDGSNKGLNDTRSVLVLAALLLAIVMGAGCDRSSTQAPQLMFVQSAEDLKVDPAAKTFRLVNVNQQTLFFSRSSGAYRRAYQNGQLSRGMDSESRQGQFSRGSS